MNISPNPASDFLTIENNDKKQIVKIINLMGKLEKVHELNLGSQKIDIADLCGGVYFLQTQYNHSYKFIKL